LTISNSHSRIFANFGGGKLIIAGLGNPGREYEETRHNVGFWAIEFLGKHFKVGFTRKDHHSLLGEFTFKGDKHFLLKPQTFMNLSGEAVWSILAENKLPSTELLTIIDDVNLPVGKIRLRPSGTAGGHNGLKSIIGRIGEDFWRLRIGVGKPTSSDLVDFVLAEMEPREREIIQKIFEDLPEFVVLLLMGKGERAMSKFNGRNYPLDDERSDVS